MADKDIVKEIIALVPVRAVVGQDRVSLRCGTRSGRTDRQSHLCRVPFKLFHRVLAGRELFQVLGKVPRGLGVGFFLDVGWSAVVECIVVHNRPYSVFNSLTSSVRGTSSLPRNARQGLSLPRWIRR